MSNLMDLKKLTPGARALLRVLSMFDGDSVPQELLTDAAKDVELEDYPSNEKAYAEACEALLGKALVTRKDDLSSLQVREQVQNTVCDELDPDLFPAVFNAAIVLLHDITKYLSIEVQPDEVREYQRHVARLRSVLEEQGIETVKPRLLAAELFNESSRQVPISGIFPPD